MPRDDRGLAPRGLLHHRRQPRFGVLELNLAHDFAPLTLGCIRGPNAPCDFSPAFAFDHSDVVLALQIEPKLCAVSEIAAESHRCIGGYRATAVEYVGDAARRYSKIEGELVRAQLARL